MNLIKITLASALGLVLIAPGANAQEPVRSKDKPNVERVKRQKDGPKARGTERAGDQRPDKQRPDAKRPDKQRPDKERPDAKRPEKERPEGRPDAKGADGKKVSEAEMIRMARREEAKHRERLGKISRLREIMTKQGQRDNLAKLDKMEAAENARYGRMVAKAKRVLGEAKFNEIHGKMEKGRTAGERPAKERPAGERPEKERPAGERPAGERPAKERPEGGR